MNVELGLRLPLDLLECFGEFEPLQGQIRNQFCQILRFLPFYRVLLKWHLSRPRSHIQRPNSAKNQSWKFLPSGIRRRVVLVKKPHIMKFSTLSSIFDSLPAAAICIQMDAKLLNLFFFLIFILWNMAKNLNLVQKWAA